MSAKPQRHLRAVDDEPTQLVNTKTGETLQAPDLVVVDSESGQHVPFADWEANFEAEYNALQGKYRAALAQITKLTKDQEAEARKHELWAEAEALHEWWRLATEHPGRKFGADEFYQVLPRLKDKDCGPVGVLHAIAGAAFDPGTKQMKNGRTERYDDWELVTRSPAKLDSFRNRAPVGADDHHWKRWLIAHIQSQLKD